MYVCGCICMYMCIYIYVYFYACVYIYTRLWCHAYKQVLLSAYVYVQLYDAFRQNFIMGCLAAVAGIVYIIYMTITSGGSLFEVIGFMMAISNTYGVILLIFLMGNGLAALPRRMWQLGDDLDELRRLYISVSFI